MNDIITINEKLDKLDEKLDKITNILETNVQICKKMAEHITFIENIYNKIKLPLSFLLNKICYMFNIQEIEL